MKSCTCASLDSPVEASRPSFHDSDDPKGFLAPRKLTRKPSKLQTSVEVTRCRFGNTSRQAAPIGYEDFVPQKDWKPIYNAVYHNRGCALHHFLHTGVSPDDTEGSGIPLLSIAAACGHFEIVKILLEAGADINAASKDKGETTLHVAIKGDRHDIIDLLLEHGADLEARTTHTGAAPLHYASNRPGSIALVTKLLKSGAQYDVQDSQCQTAAAIALQANNLHAAVAIINMACGKPRLLKREKEMLLHYVERARYRSQITNDLLAEVFAATCDPDSTVLIEAIKKNDPRLVEMFLEKGADPRRSTAKGLLPIFVAIKFADLHIIKMLVQHGADVAVRGPGNFGTLQILFKASLERDENSIVSIVDYLLAKGADCLALYPDGKTLLHRTVNGNMDRAKVVKLLLKRGIEVDVQDNQGNTALHLAAHNGLRDAARAMLDAHADTTIVDSAKRNPLLRAVLNQKWPVVQMLARPPAMTSWDAEGLTSLHHIARTTPRDGCSWEDIAQSVKPFCERSVCRSMRDRSGATPLIQAIRSLPEEGLLVVQALLAGGDRKWNCVGHEDHKSRDALYYATTLGKPAFVELLLRYDAPLVLEEWTDSKRQFKLPAASKHRLLELLVDSDRSRTVLKSQKQPSMIGETRIEIIKAEPRTISALSGYGADCETEHKSEPHRSTSRKVSLTQHLRVPATQRRTVAPSNRFPKQEAPSKQQQPRRLADDHHQTPYRSPFALNRTGHSEAGAIRYQQDDQRAGATEDSPPYQGLSGADARFPPHSSSRQHVVALATPVSCKLNSTISSNDPTVFTVSQPRSPSALPAESITITAKVDISSKVPQLPPKPHKAPTLSTPLVIQATASSDPKPVIVSPLSVKPSTPSMIYAARLITEPVKPAHVSYSASAASNPQASGKPVQPARVDSRLSMAQDSTIQALPMLDRSRPDFDDSIPKSKRQSEDELAFWLDISRTFLDK